MSLRIAAIGVSHWHSLYDAAYLRHLTRMPDVQLVGRHDPDPLNRLTSTRYLAWDSPWMLDPARSRGGCLRNLGPHGLDVFLWLTGRS
jgi:predicted dehydrogenase